MVTEGQKTYLRRDSAPPFGSMLALSIGRIGCDRGTFRLQMLKTSGTGSDQHVKLGLYQNLHLVPDGLMFP